jgi:hypothetical protein
MEKEKEKEFPANWVGGISAHPGASESARAGALAAQLAQLRGATMGNGAVARARTSERGGGADGVDGNGGRGASTGVRPAANPAAVLRRWSGSSAGKRWRSTGRCRGSRGVG